MAASRAIAAAAGSADAGVHYATLGGSGFAVWFQAMVSLASKRLRGWPGQRTRCVLAFIFCFGATSVGNAQELEPRAYSQSPLGTNFVVLAYNRSEGDVLLDPSAPLSDVDAQLNAGVLGYARTFGVGSRLASASLAMPYVRANLEGNVGSARRDAYRSGGGDARLRLAVNLIGDPAMTPAEFAKHVPRTTLGASLVVVAPVGQYDPAKLINIGSNRWAAKPEIGVSYPVGPWAFDGYAGVWLFEDNEAFFGGAVREQDPIASFQAHVSYTFRPGLWLALDANYYSGGQTTLNGRESDDEQSSSRVGLTLSVPLSKRQSLKLTWSEGATTRIGGDFTTFGIAWQSFWFD